jgi:CPA1 family monovalent cation:H+ antiporter
MRAVIYARYSSHNQREESIDDQVRVCEAAARDVGDAAVAVFFDRAASGTTDAVAVASLSKETSISSRSKSILEGESLINDASGIVAFQFAIAAAVTGTFSLVDATADFLFSFFGGILMGIALGYLGNFLVRKVRSWGLENTTFHVLFEVFTPFIVYLVANALHTSGILAVVAAGLVNVISPRVIGPSISRMNIVSTVVIGCMYSAQKRPPEGFQVMAVRLKS